MTAGYDYEPGTVVAHRMEAVEVVTIPGSDPIEPVMLRSFMDAGDFDALLFAPSRESLDAGNWQEWGQVKKGLIG